MWIARRNWIVDPRVGIGLVLKIGEISIVMEKKSPLIEVYSQYPFTLDRADDVYVWDTTGKRYIDFYGGHAVCSVGHNRAEIVSAISEQAKTFMFYSNLARIPIREKAAAALLEFGNFNDHQVFFCNSGAEANENALKVAIKLTGRSKIVAYEGAFHGRTILAVGATDHSDWHEYLKGWIGPVTRIKTNDMLGLPSIDKDTAAVILEPIQSIGKCTVFEKEYLQALRAQCNKVGALLIFDEVQTGVGRTGVPFVSTGWGVEPDITSLAKGTAGGFPIGVSIMKRSVSSQIKAGDIAATFGGGPLAMAATIATIEVIKKNNLVANAKAIEDYVRKKFAQPFVNEIRGKGCLLGIVVNREAKQVQKDLFDLGIITGPNSHPNLVHLLPPLTIAEKHVDELCSALSKILS